MDLHVEGSSLNTSDTFDDLNSHLKSFCFSVNQFTSTSISPRALSFCHFVHLLLSREHFSKHAFLSFCVSLPLSWPPISSISTFYSAQEGNNALSWTQWDSGSTSCQQNLRHSRLTVCQLIPGEQIRATPPRSVEALIHASAGAMVPLQLCPNPLPGSVSSSSLHHSRLNRLSN